MAKNLAEQLAIALEPWKARLGRITLFVGIGMVFLGFPAQIYANWQKHECGIDPVLVGVALVLYVVRIPYTISVRAWHLLPADVLGLLLSVVLVWQYINYSEEPMPSFDQIMNWVIMVTGIVNAIIIAMQGFDLLKTKNSTGVSIKMFAFFIGFQAVFALNGYRLDDLWQMWGMIASIVSTIWVLFLTIRYRKPNNEPS